MFREMFSKGTACKGLVEGTWSQKWYGIEGTVTPLKEHRKKSGLGTREAENVTVYKAKIMKLN